MASKLLFIVLFILQFSSCNTPDQQNDKNKPEKIEKINKQRCSFNLSARLYLGKIDSQFNEEGYFKIASDKSENILQLFVYNAKIDVDEKLNSQTDALNSPDVFTADSIEKITRFGNYEGKGVIMKGTYEGGVIKGTIKVFCYSSNNKGFLAIRQILSARDKTEFDMVENSFLLK